MLPKVCGMPDPNPYLPPSDLYDDQADCHTDELRDLLVLCREVIEAWGKIAALVEADIAARVPAGVHQTSDGQAFTVRKGSKKVTYDSERLWAVVTARALDERQMDPETGEYESEGAAVSRVLRSCLGKSPNWIVDGLKSHGVDPDDYREKEGRRSTVQL